MAPETQVAQAVPVVAAPQQAVLEHAEPAQASAASQTLVADGQLIRDARLDRYLAAHKEFAGSSALGLPSAFLRSATADASGR